MELWKSQNIQFVWFANSERVAALDDLAKTLLGVDVDSIQRNRLPNPSQPFLSNAEVTIDGMKFTFRLNPSRLDLILSAPLVELDGLEASNPFETKSALEHILGRFTIDFLKKIGACSRLSIICRLVNDSPTYQAAAEGLLESCNIGMSFDNHSDLSFKINKKKDFSGFTANRLVSFAIETTKTIAVEVDRDTGIAISSTQIGTEGYRSVLQLDFNTVVDGNSFAPEVQGEIFKSIADEVVRFGTQRNINAL